MPFEAEMIELKSQLTDEIYKEVIALATPRAGSFMLESIMRVTLLD